MIKRDWGWYQDIIRLPWFCLKILHFNPEAELSYQRHFHRKEYWFMLWGLGVMRTGWITTDTKEELHGFGDRCFIDVERFHQFTNYGKPSVFIEAQWGRPNEKDIERR